MACLESNPGWQDGRRRWIHWARVKISFHTIFLILLPRYHDGQFDLLNNVVRFSRIKNVFRQPNGKAFLALNSGEELMA